MSSLHGYTSKNSQSIHHKAHQKDVVEQDDSVESIETPLPATATPKLSTGQVLQLQRLIGNQAVQRVIIQRNGTPSSPPTDTWDSEKAGTAKDVISNISSVSGSTFEGIGTEMNVSGSKTLSEHWNKSQDPSTLQTVGTAGSVGTSGLMLIGNVVGTVTSSIKTSEHGKELDKLKEQGVDDSRNEFHRRRHGEGGKGVAEGVTGGAQNIFTIVTGSLNLAGKLSTVATNVLGIVGGGLGVLTGLVGMVRDSMNIHKRRKTKGKIQQLLNSYESIEKDISTQIEGKKDEVDQKLEDLKDIKARMALVQRRARIAEPEEMDGLRTRLDAINSELETLKNDADQLQNDLTELDKKSKVFAKRAEALEVAKRKQGSGSKVISLLTNIGGIGVGAVAIAAAATGLAALGPAGWAVGATLLVVSLSMLIGTKVKQAIRKSNVIRMREEREKINNFLQNGPSELQFNFNKPQSESETSFRSRRTEYLRGTLGKRHQKGAKLDGYLSANTADERKQLTWYRKMFPTTEQKGWFNKAISKSQSGTMTIGERLTYLDDYLSFYDRDSAGTTAWDGIVSALCTNEGDMPVDNPKFDNKKPESKSNKAKITLKQQITELITSFYPDKADKIIADITADGSDYLAGNLQAPNPPESHKFFAAKKVVLEKLKLAEK